MEFATVRGKITEYAIEELEHYTRLLYLYYIDNFLYGCYFKIKVTSTTVHIVVFFFRITYHTMIL